MPTAGSSSSGALPKMPGLAPIKVNLSPMRQKKGNNNRRLPQHERLQNSPAQPSPRVQAALVASAKRKKDKKRASADSRGGGDIHASISRTDRGEQQQPQQQQRQPPTAASVLSPKVVQVLRNTARAKEKGSNNKLHKKAARRSAGEPRVVALTLAALSRKRAEGHKAPALERWLLKTLSPARQPRHSHGSSGGADGGGADGGGADGGGADGGGAAGSPRQEAADKKARKKRKKKREAAAAAAAAAAAEGEEVVAVAAERASALPAVKLKGGRQRPVSAAHDALPAINTRTGTAPASFGGGALPSIYGGGSPPKGEEEGSRGQRRQQQQQQGRLPSLHMKR